MYQSRKVVCHFFNGANDGKIFRACQSNQVPSHEPIIMYLKQ